MLSAFMGFIEPGDEVIVFEPFFDQYISNIEMPGGKVVYVPLHPPKDGDTKTTSAGDWTLDMKELEAAITDRTRMIVLNSPHNPVGKVFTKEECQAIGDLCVKHNIIILSDEVYDRLYYVPFTRIGNLSPDVSHNRGSIGHLGWLEARISGLWVMYALLMFLPGLDDENLYPMLSKAVLDPRSCLH